MLLLSHCTAKKFSGTLIQPLIYLPIHPLFPINTALSETLIIFHLSFRYTELLRYSCFWSHYSHPSSTLLTGELSHMHSWYASPLIKFLWCQSVSTISLKNDPHIHSQLYEFEVILSLFLGSNSAEQHPAIHRCRVVSCLDGIPTLPTL